MSVSLTYRCGDLRRRSGRTEELKRRTLARRDLCAGAAHALERDRHFLRVRAGHAVGEDEDVVAALDQVKGGLQNANVGLSKQRSEPQIQGRPNRYVNKSMEIRHGVETNLDAEEDDGLEVVLLKNVEDGRYRHGEHRLLERAEEEGPEGRGVELGHSRSQRCWPGRLCRVR